MATFIPRFLRQLRDIVISSPADGQVLTYDSADQTWKNEAGGGGGGPPTGAAGGVLGGTYPNPGFAADMATQAELDAHINDATDAHDASAVSVVDAGSFFTGTNVETVLQEAGGPRPYGFAAISANGLNTLGGDEFIPLQVGFPAGITTAGYNTVGGGIPQSIPANGFISAQAYLPDALASIYQVFVQLEVSNADGSEKLAVSNDTNPAWIASVQPGVKNADFSGISFTVAEQIGSDLSRDGAFTPGVKIQSAAGGQFFANVYMGFFI